MPDVRLLPLVIAQSPSHGLHSVTLSFTHTITGACLAAVEQGVREHRHPCLQILNSMEPSAEHDLPDITAGCAVIKCWRTSNPAMEMEFLDCILGETSASGRAAKSGRHFTRGILIAYPYPPSGRGCGPAILSYQLDISWYYRLHEGTQLVCGNIKPRNPKTNGKAYAQQSQKFMRSAGFSPGILQQMISTCVLW
ncbi:hypothetical protein C7212DRAFT_343087 [Tuber magnatum]|uniref:Uncharacterized protein n=1 Tax=Tuber magnatum TaxID=42249 RepID=A0A317SV13_9PEZI|nr:hypothetical protein C7212DRAFT_343087 [Tuber magnatum]